MRIFICFVLKEYCENDQITATVILYGIFVIILLKK